jgi:hypothetical protein
MRNGISNHGVLWWYSSENLSPRVTSSFLERQRRLLSAAQFAREHQNQWVDAADSFCSAADIDFAMGQGWAMQTSARYGQGYVMFADIGLVANPTVVGVAHELHGAVYVDALATFQGSREKPVLLEAVEREIGRLARAFMPMRKIQIESWQGIASVQALQMRGLPIEIFTPTAKAHSEQWPILQQRLASRTLVLYPHPQLREELLNLVVELTSTGIRVIDAGSVHQDHAVVVRGLCAMLQPKSAAGPSIAAILPADSGGAAATWRDQYFR